MFFHPADYLNDTADARINEAKESDGGNAGSTLFSLSRRERGRGFVCRLRRVYNACTICAIRVTWLIVICMHVGAS